jgi:hypothetical protein
MAELGGPALASLLGKETAANLTPMAEKALNKLIHSKMTRKLAHNIGNKFFGKKHKTARSFLRKGRSVAGVAFGKKGHKFMNRGLDLGTHLGMLDKNQAHNIKNAYEKASSFHDKLSKINKHKTHV